MVWVCLLFIVVFVGIMIFVLPIKEEFYCNKSTNWCFVTRKYLTGRIKTEKLADYDAVIGAEVISRSGSRGGETYYLYLVTSNQRKVEVFAGLNMNYKKYKGYADYLNQEFSRQAEKIILKNSNAVSTWIFIVIPAIIGFLILLSAPTSQEFYCSKSANSCIMTSDYLTGRQKKVKLADYDTVIGAEVSSHRGTKGSTEYNIDLVTSNQGKVKVFDTSSNYNKHQREADYLNQEFSRQVEEIRLKRGFFD